MIHLLGSSGILSIEDQDFASLGSKPISMTLGAMKSHATGDNWAFVNPKFVPHLALCSCLLDVSFPIGSPKNRTWEILGEPDLSWVLVTKGDNVTREPQLGWFISVLLCLCRSLFTSKCTKLIQIGQVESSLWSFNTFQVLGSLKNWGWTVFL